MLASVEERAQRRYQEILAQGKTADFGEILRAMRERDKQDQEKPISPMVPASDAVIIETDNMNIEEVLTYLKQLITAVPSIDKVDNEH